MGPSWAWAGLGFAWGQSLRKWAGPWGWGWGLGLPLPPQVPELELTPLETPESLPPTLAHGTRRRLWDSIRRGGLSRRGRTHIHLAPGLPGDAGVLSGERRLPPLQLGTTQASGEVGDQPRPRVREDQALELGDNPGVRGAGRGPGLSSSQESAQQAGRIRPLQEVGENPGVQAPAPHRSPWSLQGCGRTRRWPSSSMGHRRWQVRAAGGTRASGPLAPTI